MNDQTKAAPAVAETHKVPSQHEIDLAGDELASLQMKLGKAQRKAILSAGVARADQHALEEIEKATTKARDKFQDLVDRFTLPPVKVDIPAALEAVRERLAPATATVILRSPEDDRKIEAALEGAQDPKAETPKPLYPKNPKVGDTWLDLDGFGHVWTGEGWKRQDPEAAEAVKAELMKPSGGFVEPNPGYLVGEKGAEMIVPADSELGKAVAAGMSADGSSSSIIIEGTAGADGVIRRVAVVSDFGTDKMRHNGGSFRERLAPQKMEEVEKRAFAPEETTKGERWRNAHKGRTPPLNPQHGDVWLFPDVAELDGKGVAVIGGGRQTVEMFWDRVSGWSMNHPTEPDLFVQVKASDLTADYYEADRLAALMRDGLPKPEKKPGLFAKFTGR